MSGTSKHTRSRKQQGAGLPTTLMVAALMLALGFTVVAVGFNHLNVSARLSNAQVANNLAESVISKAIEEVIVDETFGTSSWTGSSKVEVTFAANPDALGVLTFDAAEADTLEISHSTNNLASDTSAAGDDGRQVPPEAVHLVGVGTCNGVERRIEAVVHVPRFPYGVASSGPIVSNGGLLVAEVADASVLDAGYPIPNDELLPGNIATNSTVGSLAVDFDTGLGPIDITGDLQSASGATLTDAGGKTLSDIVGGETRLGASQVQLPDVDIVSYAPDPTNPDVTMLSNSTETTPITVSGLTRRDGNLTIFNQLDLDGGVLYVDGDLTITQGVKGKGAIIATGKIEITGNSSASSDNRAALLAGGNIKLVGSSKDAARIEGLVYTEGDLLAQDITLSGVAVANKPTGSTTQMDNVNYYETDEFADFSVTDPGPGGGGSSYFLESGSGSVQPPTPMSLNGYSFTPQFAVNSVPPELVEDPSGELAFNISGSTFTYNPGPPSSLIPSGAAAPAMSITDYPVTIGSHVDMTDETTIYNALVADYTASQGAPSPTDLTQLAALAANIHHGPALGLAMAKSYQLFRDGGGSSGLPPAPGGGPPGGGGGSTLFSISLSDFLRLEEKMKVLYWKEQPRE